MITIYGASDDLIEIEGDITEEFYAIDGGEYILGFSDGTVLSVEYDAHGVWRIRRLATGVATYRLTEADSNYTDRVDLDGPIKWVVVGRNWKKTVP